MSELISKEQFRLANGLVIDLSLDWETQKKVLGYNLSHTTSSFGRVYPELILHENRYHASKYELLEKDKLGHKYYVLDYEYNLSKVRTVKVCNQFSVEVTLWERHNVFTRFFKRRQLNKYV